MNAAHLHLVVNHLPVFAGLFGGLLLATGLLARKKLLADPGLVLAVIAALGAFLAVQTGERAEEVLEGYAGVSEATIHEHEEAAEIATAAAVVMGFLALTPLVLPGRAAAPKRWATVGALTLTVLAFGLVARAANLGGQVRHPEIANGATVLLEGVEDEAAVPALALDIRRGPAMTNAQASHPTAVHVKSPTMPPE